MTITNRECRMWSANFRGVFWSFSALIPEFVSFRQLLLKAFQKSIFPALVSIHCLKTIITVSIASPVCALLYFILSEELLAVKTFNIGKRKVTAMYFSNHLVLILGCSKRVWCHIKYFIFRMKIPTIQKATHPEQWYSSPVTTHIEHLIWATRTYGTQLFKNMLNALVSLKRVDFDP